MSTQPDKSTTLDGSIKNIDEPGGETLGSRAEAGPSHKSTSKVSSKRTSSARASATRQPRRRKKGKSIIDLEDASFDPNATELWTTWSSYASVIACVNSYPNGITFSLHSNEEKKTLPESGPDSGAMARRDKNAEEQLPRKFIPSQFHLRFRDTRDYQTPQGKYFLYKENYVRSLERQLGTLHKKGLLADATVYFGTTTDPFSSFHKKFDITTACLELFEAYKPARLVVQTRSPMVISALPTLRRLADRAVAVIPIESHVERSIARYTPGQPRIAERLVAAEGLRRQGVKVNLVASPILPYGEFYRDAWDFAEVLERHADYVTLGCLASGSESDERQLRTLPVARKIATDKQFRWLRPHAYRYLYHALSVIAPEKLLVPVAPKTKASQLDLFAA